MAIEDIKKKINISNNPDDFEEMVKRGAQSQERARKVAPVKNIVNSFSNMSNSAKKGITQGIKKNTFNKTKYIAKNLGVGTLQGTAGIPQAILTESANEMQKGQNKDIDEIIRKVGRAVSNNPMNMIDNTIEIAKNNINTLKDKDKNAWQKLINIATNTVSGSSKTVTPGYSIFSALNQTAGKIAPQASNTALDLNNKISVPINNLQQKLAEEGQNYDGITRFLGEGANVIGNMAPSIATSAITKNPKMAEDVALATMGLSAKGQSTNEALNKGASLDEAVKIGDTKALTEVGTEKMTGGAKLFGGGTNAEEALRKQIKDKVGSKVLQTIANTGLDIAGEGLEETVSDIVDTAIDKGTTDPNASYSLKDWGKTQGITALTTLALNGLGIGGNAITQRINNIGTAPIQQTQNQPTAPVNTLNQQQNQTVQNRNMEQIKIDSENFSRQIDDVKNGTFPQKDMLTLGKTPQALIDIGLPDLPITMTQRHLDTIMNESGKYKNANYHGLGEEIVKQLPEAINNPLDIVKSNTKDDSVVLTTYLADKQGRPVIASIKIDGTGRVNDIMIDTNVMTSAYGRNSYDKFMQDNIKNGNLLYDIDRGVIKKVTGARLQLPRTSNFSTNDGSFINNSIPQNTDNVNNTTINNNYAQNTQNDTQNQPIPLINNTQGETVNWNEIEKPEGKIRKHYKSIIESSNTTAEAKKIARELMGSDTYVARSNNELLNEADRRINTAEPDTELNKLLSKAMNNEKIKDVDIAVGERLIEYYSKVGDKAHLQDAIHATAMAGTQAGRTVQAMALLNHMTPQGQVVWLDRSINKMNNELQQKYKNKQNVPQFKLTPEMQQKIMETNNQEEMTKALDEVYEELGQQVPKTLAEQIDEWRYFSMLANIKTHGRNMIGNFAMGITQRVKNKVAGAIEGTAAQFNPNMERTHTLRPTSKEVKQFAKKDVLNADVQTELGMNENKYTPQSRLQNARKTFKSDTFNNSLGKLFDLNSKLLEVEDNIGLKSMYVNALGEYITANNIDVNNITDVQLQKARKHAIKEAQEATFHQSSALATALNQMGRTSNIKKFALDAAVPFKKTPINVAKTGVQYSPVGLIKSAVFDIGKVRRGNISVNEYIDNISKGLTGTGITFLGYALAQAGILKASGGDDDKKEKYDEEQGKQKYSIEIGGKTATLDWLSPAGIPLFIGAEINQQFNQTKKEKTNKSTDDNETLYQIIRKVGGIGTGLSNIMNPMTEMSMVSGLTSILSSYNKENAVGDVIVNTGKSYINQFVPTALGQLARTTDEYERTTKSTKTGTFEKAADSTINQIKSKVPGLRQTLPIKTDIWGKEIKQSENLPFKAFNNFINPSTIKDVSTNKVDKELNNLYSKTKNGAIIPKAIENKFTIDGTDYRMSNKEYAKYYKNYGKTSYNLIKELISNEDYKSMNTEQKEKAIENVYSYAKEKNKVDYAKANKLKVEPSTLYNTMEELKSKGGNQSSYLQYISKTTGVEKESERNKILAESDYTSKTKSIIYSNGTGKDDKFYNTAGKNIDIDEYLKYKTTITNKSKKEEVVKYVNSNVSKYNDRLLILANKYKLSNNDRKNLAEYINTLDNYMEIYEKLNKNYTVKNGKVYYK